MKMHGDSLEKLGGKTIDDFGEQWTAFSDTSGFFGSWDLLADFIHPFDMARFRGARVADIGAVTGRHVQGLLAAGAREVLAIEPSKAIELVRKRFGDGKSGKMVPMQLTGALLPPPAQLNSAVSGAGTHPFP